MVIAQNKVLTSCEVLLFGLKTDFQDTSLSHVGNHDKDVKLLLCIHFKAINHLVRWMVEDTKGAEKVHIGKELEIEYSKHCKRESSETTKKQPQPLQSGWVKDISLP